MFACTDTQYVPALSAQLEGRLMLNEPVPAPDAIATLLNVQIAAPPGSVPELGKKNTFTEVAGPVPLKYWPPTFTELMFHVAPAGTTKSSAVKSSNVSNDASKFCELVAVVAALSVWSYNVPGVPLGVHEPVGEAVAVAVAVAVGVDVGVLVAVPVGVGVPTAPHGMPVIESILTPTAATLLSDAILHLRRMDCPLADAGRVTVEVM